MEHLGFAACLADPDAWVRPEMKANGQEHYEHVLLCADDALVASDEASDFFRNQIGKCFVVNKGSIGPPTRCLGRSVRKFLLDNNADAWAFSGSQHVRASVDNVDNCVKIKGIYFPKS